MQMNKKLDRLLIMNKRNERIAYWDWGDTMVVADDIIDTDFDFLNDNWYMVIRIPTHIEGDLCEVVDGKLIIN